MMTEKQQAAAAAKFAERWQGRGYERGDSQPFWMELLSQVYGIENPSEFIRFEENAKVDRNNFIDGHIPSTKVLIEQKSIDKDLRAPILQSDGRKLTPYEQARQYVANMPLSQHPKWIVTCNFNEFLIYDMEQPNGKPEQLFLKDLGKEYYRLRFLVDVKSEHITKEMMVSLKAGEIVAKIYNALLKQYNDNSPKAQRWLNILCVRIVFCLYAEDAGIFNRDQFHDYLAHYDAEDIGSALDSLFEILNTPINERSKYLKEDLQAFPYTNGGLFDEKIEIPQFTEELKKILLQNASLDFNWRDISPTIFGAVFESTLNPETRRSGGMHYTSIENIHKVIDPLFLNDLRRELDAILEEKNEKQRQKKLDDYQNKLSHLTFLDPACGSGNFLTETYLSLRRLENEVIREKYHNQMMMGEFLNPIKVSIHQFYGIEINDFAVTVATTALWISEAQMMAETEKIIQHDIDFLPLKSYANIKEGNALSMDWSTLEEEPALKAIYTDKLNVYKVKDFDEVPQLEEKQAEYQTAYKEINVVAKEVEEKELPERKNKVVVYDYIIGNPPFVGARMMNGWQKKDMLNIFGNQWKNLGDLDYVCAWYKKSVSLMLSSPSTKSALVSTNSITQGAAVSNLWEPLFDSYGLHFDFAYQTFRWDSESSQKAAVHCVIIGFSVNENTNSKIVFINDRQYIKANNINGYLMDAPNIWITSRNKPLCDVPPLLTGSQRIDNDLFMFDDETKADFIKKEPAAEKYFRRWYGADEFINNRPRWVLYLGNCDPSELKDMPHCYEIVRKVQEYRLESKREATRKAAFSPNHFGLEIIPIKNFMIVPVVSSEKRLYIPIGFMSPEVMCSNQINLIPEATLYHFGILTSNVHMAWMRAVCGRLKSDYRYSKDIVYNNFPWPNPTEEQKAKIEQTAQAILDARAKYPTSSLADLYDEVTMPIELRKAHKENDKAVMQAYHFNLRWLDYEPEAKIVAELFKLYQNLTK